MTSTFSAVSALCPAQLGTLVVIAWKGDHPDDERDMPFLLAYSLGDGEGGPDAAAVAARQLIEESGLPIGSEYVDVVDAVRDGEPSITLAIEDGGRTALLTMPHLSARCAVSTEWLTAVRGQGHVYFLFATRPWPKAAPGVPVSEGELRDFVGDEAVLSTAAHCLLPVRRLQA
ncbi:DUF5949 family protein [Streptomyces sp. NPDC127084]|uniref:DUF5949 family protein n=1 Tax=Streptomyces sp. NPDC127084 TaxID=3347133 RepID=UPI003667F4F2